MTNFDTGITVVQDGYASVNGLDLYYERYSARSVGTPLVLLHGGLGTIHMFETLLPLLASGRPVIGVELQGHGHTALGSRPLNFEAMGDDLAALIKHLGLAQVDLLGYSLGGGAAWQTAIRHPEVVRKLVAVSAPIRRSGWYPEVLAGMAAMNAESAQAMLGSPMYADYAAAAPNPQDWPALVAGVGELLKQDYDWSQAVSGLKVPALIVIGDGDSLRPAHAVEIFELLGGGKTDGRPDGMGLPPSRLAILPSTTHYNILYSPLLAPTLISFLDAQPRR
jgi:pimeloyl-ACP methyl ester carboxylesterase